MHIMKFQDILINKQIQSFKDNKFQRFDVHSSHKYFFLNEIDQIGYDKKVCFDIEIDMIANI